MPTNDGPVLTDFTFVRLNEIGCSEIITLTVNINVYNTLFQYCNRQRKLLHTYHLTR